MSNDDSYLNLTIDAMNQIFGYPPHEFQKQVIPHILQMKPNTCHAPTPCLIVQGTGGGKSSVYQSIGIIKGGVSFIIQNTLALSSDQLSKISQLNRPNIKCIQLDSLKSHHHRRLVYDFAIQLSNRRHYSLFLFNSPEALCNPIWSKLVDVLIMNNTISQVVVDEVHLFVQYGLSFRSRFLDLKKTLFDKLVRSTSDIVDSESNSSGTICPVVFMTATFNNTLLSYLSRICGYSIKSQHTFWADKTSFRKRYIDISVVFTPQKRKVIKESILETCANNLQNKLIVYSNVSSRLEEIQHDVDDWMDENEKLVGDTILINGELESEWKFISVQKFTNTTTELNKVVGDNQFYPRILFATASCIGAGLDSKDVRKVIREGFPPSILDFIQEMGRCGRNVNDMSDNHMGSKDEYKLILSLNEFIYMYERIYLHSFLTKEEEDRIGKIVSTDKLKNEQRELLLSLLSMIVLDKGCWHIQLERTLAQDETVSIAQQSRDEPCFNKCPNCNTNRNKKLGYVVPMKKRGMKKFLSQTFCSGRSNDDNC